MSKKLEFSAESHDNKMMWLGTNRATVVQMVCEGLKGKIKVTFEEDRPTRSTKQNAYYWTVVIPLCVKQLKEFGNRFKNPNLEVHNMFKDEFLPPVPVRKENGQIIGYIKPTTTKEDTVEFWEYVDRCREWAAENLGINIPDPPEKESHF